MANRHNSKVAQQLGPIQSSAPPDSSAMSPSELFGFLCTAGDWKYSDIADVISFGDETGKLEISEDTVKTWGSKSRNKVPDGKYRNILIHLIKTNCVDGVDAQEWIDALIHSWARKRITGRVKDLPLQETDYKALICQTVLTNPKLTYLPSLFETDTPLPLATAYVDLRLAPITPNIASPVLLEQNLSLAQQIYQRIEARFAVRRSPKDILDGHEQQTSLILGPPGAGKSSLLHQTALDIAGGQWQSAKIPLFVEARAYWASRKAGSPLDLLSFALKESLPLGHDVTTVLGTLLTQQEQSGHRQLILLVDGLDEIAGNQDAIQFICNELRSLARSIPWIITSRPTATSLMPSLGETHRCEMVELDEEAIETLIDNWCSSINLASKSLDAVGLKTEILGTTSTRDMAGNPFLLTALCFLKSTAPENSLPKSRISVYESLLQQIALQAQRRHSDPDILSPKAREVLGAFAINLYTRPDGPIQIFDQEHWWQFCKQYSSDNSVDFHRHILRGRLLSEWKDDTPRYHFLHLSLQEHLVARAMLKGTVQQALERRFSPVWRSVFRFYGALLWHKGRADEFRELTNALCDEQDINGFSFLTLAHIFADAGIQDTSDWIGGDLRDTLYHMAISAADLGQEAMIDALAALDPKWLEVKTLEEMEERNDTIENHSDSEQNRYSGENFVVIGRNLDVPYEKLARARTSSAKRLITDAFWGSDQNRALMSAYAFSTVATPSDRQKIVTIAANIELTDALVMRFFAFAQTSLRQDFVPFLGRLVNNLTYEADERYQDCLKVLADTGGHEAANILEQQAVREAHRLAEEFNAFELVLSVIVRMGGNEALRILDTLAALPEASDWHDSISIKRFEANPSEESAVIDSLSDHSRRSETLSALCGAANYGRVPSRRVVESILEHLDLDSISDVMDLAFIEGGRLDAGELPILCDSLLELANRLYKRIQDADDENARDYLTTQISLIFDTLGRAPWYPAQTLVKTILFAKDPEPDLVNTTIELAGHVFSNTLDAPLLERLKTFLFQLDSDYSHSSALAIGRINLEELFRLQDAESASVAMEQIAAEQNLLIFDHFWADRYGVCFEWKNPPKKILHVYDDSSPDLPQLFVHELSRYGFLFDAHAPDECVAFLIYKPTGSYVKELEEAARTLASEQHCLIDIPLDISEAQARRMAQQIGKKLVSRYESLTPPVHT